MKNIELKTDLSKRWDKEAEVFRESYNKMQNTMN
jgi:hypothetical protein